MPHMHADMDVGLHEKCPLFFSNFNQNQNMPIKCSKNLLIGYQIKLKSI
jgi:hypothetical protein